MNEPNRGVPNSCIPRSKLINQLRSYASKMEEFKTRYCDISLWIVGLRGGPLALASLVLGYIKSLVDDDMERKAKAAIRQEPQLYRKNIVPLAGGWGPPSALAAAVAPAYNCELQKSAL